MTNDNIIRKDVPAPVAEMAAKLLPVVARKKAARSIPDYVGQSFFYTVAKGWQTDALRLDKNVALAPTTMALEKAFADTAVKTILIPSDGSITKAAALQICSRHAQGKTIFYEVEEHE